MRERNLPGILFSVLVLVVVCAMTLEALAQEVSDARKARDVEAIQFSERQIEAALVSGDLRLLSERLGDDLIFHHGDDWLVGGDFLYDDTKHSLHAIAASGNYVSREVMESVVEIHGDIGISRGLSRGRLKRDGELLTFRTRYLRIYQNRGGVWQLISHFTTQLMLDARESLPSK